MCDSFSLAMTELTGMPSYPSHGVWHPDPGIVISGGQGGGGRWFHQPTPFIKFLFIGAPNFIQKVGWWTKGCFSRGSRAFSETAKRT